MKIKNFSTYEFNQYNVVGLKAKINFVKTNNLERDMETIVIL